MRQGQNARIRLNQHWAQLAVMGFYSQSLGPKQWYMPDLVEREERRDQELSEAAEASLNDHAERLAQDRPGFRSIRRHLL
eukprot:g42629.t1